MVSQKHSKRAMSNTRKQVNGWIRELRSIVALKQKEVTKIRSYRKYKLPGQAKMEKAAEQGLAQVKRQLQQYTKLKQKYERDGLI